MSCLPSSVAIGQDRDLPDPRHRDRPDPCHRDRPDPRLRDRLDLGHQS